MKVALAQINSLIGDISYNEKQILKYIKKAQKQNIQLIIFPEMALCGYSPLDLLKQKKFLKKAQQSIVNIHKQVPKNMAVLLGGLGGKTTPKNTAFFLQKHKPLQSYSKQYLADYGVFDEQRYFKKGILKNNIVTFQNTIIQILICEELWHNPNIILKSPLKKPHLIIAINASPYDINKHAKRINAAQKWTKKNNCPLFYINTVGGQDELIFDGGSFILQPSGKCVYQMPFFKEALGTYYIPENNKIIKPLVKKTSQQEHITQALVFGLKEFIKKNNFKKIHLGLSGGVDSALVAYLACKALGPKNVTLLFLPNIFTSKLSEKGALKIAQQLKCVLITNTIKQFYLSFLKVKSLNFKKSHPTADLTKQNIQARLRCLFLMAFANNNPHSLLLSTSNKSELSVGYGTLYGDLAGGLLPIGDLFKTEVYKLAHHLKVPNFILNKAPSAELKENQKDEDDLPAYEILDPVLQKLIEKTQAPSTAFEKKIFITLINSEFKRKQSPPILKIKPYGFDRGWRLPLSIKKNSLEDYF